MVNTSNEECIQKLLTFTLYKFANQLDLAPPPPPLSLIEITTTLNYADKLSRKKNDKLANTQATILCGLVSESLPTEAIAAPAFITSILLRLGLTPTAKMVQTKLLPPQDNVNTEHYLEDLGGFVENLTQTLKIASNQVHINGQKVRLTEFQKRMWDSIEQFQNIGISAPTSAGKSFLLSLKIIDFFSKSDGTVIYIVPTISLVNQVSRDIAKVAKTYNVTGLKVFKSFARSLNRQNSPYSKGIYVLTQERASAYFSSPEERINLTSPLFVIVDEIQNVEQISNEKSNERAMVLLDVINNFVEESKPHKFIISGPRLKNLQVVLDSWVAGESKKCESDTLPTVVNISYSFRKIKDAKGLRKEYVTMSQHVDGFGTCSIDIFDNHNIKNQILGKSRYPLAAHTFLTHIMNNLKGDGGTLIFSKSSHQCFKTAEALANNENDISEDLESLVEYCKESVHQKYGLAYCLERGIAYHHGKVPHHIRNSIETAFSKGLVKQLVCTSTLMQGVNLPAKNIIVRNPEIAKKELSAYEFANLRGRAGRLMQDFVGRAILIDEEYFTGSSIDLSSSAEKELDFTYKSKYQGNKAEIIEVLLGTKPKELAKPVSADLAIFIKQQFYKYSQTQAERKLNSLGIDLQPNVINSILAEKKSIQIPLEIILLNPFWDPKDLAKLYILVKDRSIQKVPKSPYQDLSKSLLNASTVIKDNLPYYYKKYLDINGTGRLSSICSFAEKWACGVPLSTIIDPDGWPITTSEDVESRLATISGIIPFDMTKLVRPIVSIQNPNKDNNILTYLETGCFDIEQRTLLSLGLAREVTLKAFQKLDSSQIGEDDAVDIESVVRELRRKRNSSVFSHWEQIQVEETLNFDV